MTKWCDDHELPDFNSKERVTGKDLIDLYLLGGTGGFDVGSLNNDLQLEMTNFQCKKCKKLLDALER